MKFPAAATAAACNPTGRFTNPIYGSGHRKPTGKAAADPSRRLIITVLYKIKDEPASDYSKLSPITVIIYENCRQKKSKIRDATRGFYRYPCSAAENCRETSRRMCLFKPHALVFRLQRSGSAGNARSIFVSENQDRRNLDSKGSKHVPRSC
jgi:hypothetical protein